MTVDSGGRFTATLGAGTALALHVNARTCGSATATGASFAVNATTAPGQDIYVTGDRPELGGWNTGAALKLDPAAYPVWKLDVPLPAGTAFAYKYVRKDGAGNVTWESGANRAATVPANGTVTLTDTWRS